MEKPNYVLMSCCQSADQNRDIKIADRSFENVSLLQYLRTTLTNRNFIREEIKRRLNSGNACYHSVQNLLSSHLLAKHIKFTKYKTIILPVVLSGCGTWSPILRKEHRLRVFDITVPRRIFGPKRDEMKGAWRNLHNEELRDLYSSPSIIKMVKSRRMEWDGHVARILEVIGRNSERNMSSRKT
jgi:hypothetical protein